MAISSATNPVVDQITIGGASVTRGSGSPVGTAGTIGSLYLRTDGSTTATRLYINSTGLTAWVAITTAS